MYDSRVEGDHYRAPKEGLTAKCHTCTIGDKPIRAGMLHCRLMSEVSVDCADCDRMRRDVVAGWLSLVINDEDGGLDRDSLQESMVNVAEWDTVYGTQSQ